jgi:AcrR family transcriptional regulator
MSHRPLMAASIPPSCAFRLVDELREQASAAPTKVERTRLTLMASAAVLLDGRPFAQIRPADLAAHAQMSRAVIYHRFTDLPALVAELMETFERRVTLDLSAMAPRAKGFDYPTLVHYLSWTLNTFMRNRGIMRLLLSHADQVPGVDVVVERTLLAFNRVLGDAAEPPKGKKWSRANRLVVGYMIGGGVSDVLRRMLQPGHDELTAPRTPAEMLELVQLMAVIRHREMHGCDPTPEAIRTAGRSFDLSVFAPALGEVQASTLPSAPMPLAMQRLRRMASKGAT